MIDERIIELYRSQLAAANEEKGMLYAQVKALSEEVSMLRLSMEQSKQATDDILSEIKSLCKKLKEKDPMMKRRWKLPSMTLTYL